MDRKRNTIIGIHPGAERTPTPLPVPTLGFPVDTIPTGSLSLDLALGIGGLPRPGITLAYGSEAAGKTTLCLLFLSKAQKMGGLTALIDLDGDLPLSLAAGLFPAESDLLVARPPDLWDALEIARILVESGSLAAVAIDTIMDIPQDDGQPRQLKRFEQLLEQLGQACDQAKTALLLTQRPLPGVSSKRLGRPMPLDQVLYHSASIVLEMNSMPVDPTAGPARRNRAEIQVKKNKFAPTHPAIVLDILYNEVNIKIEEIFDLGLQFNLITQQGIQYWYSSLLLGRGSQAARTFLLENPALESEIEKLIRKRFLPPRLIPVAH